MTLQLALLDNLISAHVEGELVGTARLASWTETTGLGLFLIALEVAESVRSTGVTQALLNEGEKIQRKRAQTYSEYTNFFGANATSDEPDMRAFLERNGYSVTFSVVDMELDLQNFPLPVPPTDYAIELLDHKDARRVADLMMESYEDREFIVEMDDDDLNEFADDMKKQGSFTYCAKDGDEIVGFTYIRVTDDLPYVGQMSVDPRYHRQGIARALMATALNDLKNQGYSNVWLDTSGENVSGAKSLYSSLGFEVCKTHLRYRKPID